jgi:hypothetical protein
MPLPPQLFFRWLFYLSYIIDLGLTDLSRIMSLPTSLSLRVQVRLKGFSKIMLLPVSFVRMSIPLYVEEPTSLEFLFYCNFFSKIDEDDVE